MNVAPRLKQGYSVIEMLIAMAILAIIAVISTSAIQSFVSNNRSQAVANELALSLRFAKTEAITLNTPISLCAASSSAKSDCNEQADWQYGWIIFRDPTQTGQLANLDDRIKVSAELPKGVTISSSITHLTFENQGFLSSNSGDLIISATGCSGEHRYTLSLSALGRVDSSKSTC